MDVLRAPPVGRVCLRDGFFRPRVEANHAATLPACLRFCRDTGRFDAFRLDWKPGQPNRPHIFWDSDVAKVLEGMAYDLVLFPDAERAAELERLVDLVVSAQRPDGYLNTYFTGVEPDRRWDCLAYDHELYCAGHLIEAAVAHHAATGDRRFIDAMRRCADYIASVFGRAPGQKRGYPGHPEIELALCRLAAAEGEPRYAGLAAYFVDERGRAPNYFNVEAERTGRWVDLANIQAHAPVHEQDGPVGHAVRALYLLSGMADLAARGDEGLLAACRRQAATLFEKRMYVTGGAGALPHGEAFGPDYHLPNDTAYAESCAAIALVLFASRMANLTGESLYADAMERALYNGALAGLSLDGTGFFYANPLEIDDDTLAGGHIARTRQSWFGCSCCPANYARFLPQIGSFLVAAGPDALVLHVPAAMEADLAGDGWSARLEVSGGYPYDGRIRMVLAETEGTFAVKLRIPDWCGAHALRVNGETAAFSSDRGYAVLASRAWRAGDVVEMDLAMPARRVRCHPKATANAGKVALARGPVVYAVESVDNGPGLAALSVPADAPVEAVSGDQLPGGPLPAGMAALRFRALRDADGSGGRLYYDCGGGVLREEGTYFAVPSALWQNRGEGSMRIWLREAR